MGHKVHPTGFRLGIVKGWQSTWYAERDYKDIVAEDIRIRQIINKELANASVSKIEIERAATDQVLVTVWTAKPGIVIGKSGEKVDRLRSILEGKTKKRRVRIEIKEIRQPELDAFLVARSIAEQLERRISFRRAMKQAVQKSIRANAKGIKVIVGGRLGGAEIARTEKEVEGKVPLHTIRADIDYGFSEAHTTFGVIGIKVWIYKGEILPSKRREGVDGQPETATIQPAYVQREAGERRGRRPGGGGDGQRSDGQRGERRPGGGDRPRGDRPRGDRPQGQGGDRGPRPQGDRPPRPQGDRPPRPQGDRPPRAQGDRPPRPQGDRPPRPQGERGERPPRAEHTPASSTSPDNAVTPAQQPTPPTQTTPPETPTNNAGTSGATQSE